jgi:hypothetical protein
LEGLGDSNSNFPILKLLDKKEKLIDVGRTNGLPLYIYLFPPMCFFFTPVFHFCPCIKTSEPIFQSFSSLNSKKLKNTFQFFFKAKENSKNAFRNIYSKAKIEKCLI